MKSLGTKWKTYTESERQEILEKEIVYLTKIWGENSYEVKMWKERLERQILTKIQRIYKDLYAAKEATQ